MLIEIKPGVIVPLEGAAIEDYWGCVGNDNKPASGVNFRLKDLAPEWTLEFSYAQFKRFLKKLDEPPKYTRMPDDRALQYHLDISDVTPDQVRGYVRARKAFYDFDDIKRIAGVDADEEQPK